MRVSSSITSVAGLLAVSLLLVGCAAQAAPAAAPTTVPAATATTAPAIPSPTLAAPTATPAASATKSGESLIGTVTTPTAAAGDLLKPATATPGLKPATTPPVQGRDSLKPVETPKPVQPTAAPGNGGKIKPVTKLQAPPTPAAPARKGVANPNVDPQKYLTELVTDLQQLADAVNGLGEITNAYESGQATEDQVVSGFQKQADVVRAVYQREVQRDYPPQLKEIDDYFVESLRSASKMVDSLVMALQTGDQKYVTEAEGQAQKFEFFANELVKRLQ